MGFTISLTMENISSWATAREPLPSPRSSSRSRTIPSARWKLEMTLEDDYGMIDGVINNGRRGEELEKAREHAERTQPEKKPSIRERLAAAKQECAKQQPRPATEKKPPELGER